jgi:imidazolonepropionase-like amidohydrolase
MSRSPTCLLVSALLSGAFALAQDLLPKAAPQAGPIVLTNAVLHTVSGPVILGGSLWFENGTIRAVLAADQKPELPAGATAVIIDLQGKHVYPGFVSAHTSLGLEEIGMVRQTVDVDEVGELTPEALALTAVNPDTTAIPVARSNGILAAAVFPRGGLLPGRVSLIQLDGWTNGELAVRGDAGPVVAWPARSYGNPSRRGRRGDAPQEDPATAVKKARQQIADAFLAARAWLQARTVDPTIALDIRHLALVPALRGETPVFVQADQLEQIESAVLWAVEQNLHIVIVGGREALLCADLLRRHNVPVVIDGTHKLPQRDDSPYSEAFELPSQLAKAGVRFCIASGSDFSQERNLPYQAATAIAFGLEPKEALAAVTLRAAEILGVGDRLGSLTVGKDATLFVCDGDPLELTTKIEQAYVKGKQIDLRNKQTELAQKYRERYHQLQKR